MKRVVIYSPSTNNIPNEKIGGAEVGAKRIINLLKTEQFEVVQVAKPTLYYGIIRYIKEYFIAKKKLKKELSVPNTIFYCVGFYYKNCIVELNFINIAKKKKCNIIYEPKNGTFVKSLKSGGIIYNFLMKKIMSSSTKIFCQGIEYFNYLNLKYSNKAVYVPNYINESLIITQKEFSNENIFLTYWGRLTQSKNIDLIIKIFDELSMRIKQNVVLTLIGAVDEGYEQKFNEIVLKSSNNKNINVYNRMSLLDIKKIVQDHHFYIFPSNEKNEGHSNSLTEAMSFGLVPVVSNVGFNSDIIKEKKLIIDNFDVNNYVDVIYDIINNNSYKEYSSKLVCRVLENYTNKVIEKRIIDTINDL